MHRETGRVSMRVTLLVFQAASWNLWLVHLRVFKALKYSFFTKLWRRKTRVGAIDTNA